MTAAPSSSAQAQKALPVGQDRRDESKKRIELHQTAALITTDGHSVEVILKDVPLDGFRIEHAGEDFEPGDIVSLRSGRWTGVRAQIKWVTDREAGGIFLDHPDFASGMTNRGVVKVRVRCRGAYAPRIIPNPTPQDPQT